MPPSCSSDGRRSPSSIRRPQTNATADASGAPTVRSWSVRCWRILSTDSYPSIRRLASPNTQPRRVCSAANTPGARHRLRAPAHAAAAGSRSR
eukprot:3491916-Prymnesium_polylepis.2